MRGGRRGRRSPERKKKKTREEIMREGEGRRSISVRGVFQVFICFFGWDHVASSHVPHFFQKKKKKELGHACSRVGHELGNPSAMSVLSRILVICLFGKRDFWEGRETQSDSVKETRVFVMICFFGKVNWEVWGGGVVGETWVVTFTILFGLILYNYISILNFLYYHVVQIF